VVARVGRRSVTLVWSAIGCRIRDVQWRCIRSAREGRIVTDPAPIVFIDPAARVEIRALDPALDEEAAAIIAATTGAGTTQRGREMLGGLRADDAVELYGLFAGGALAAVYTLRREALANEVTHLAVKDGERRKGHGRACLQDALRRSGKRPLIVETAEDAIGFYKACGFKLVGRRKQPSGTVRYRLGWHAPRPAASALTPRPAPRCGRSEERGGG